jgi:hypothetical protein
VPAETGRRKIVDVASVALKRPIFIGLSRDRFKDSHSMVAKVVRWLFVIVGAWLGVVIMLSLVRAAPGDDPR